MMCEADTAASHQQTLMWIWANTLKSSLARLSHASNSALSCHSAEPIIVSDFAGTMCPHCYAKSWKTYTRRDIRSAFDYVGFDISLSVSCRLISRRTVATRRPARCLNWLRTDQAVVRHEIRFGGVLYISVYLYTWNPVDITNL